MNLRFLLVVLLALVLDWVVCLRGRTSGSRVQCMRESERGSPELHARRTGQRLASSPLSFIRFNGVALIVDAKHFGHPPVFLMRPDSHV